jgi:hypothetical protein
LHAFKKISRLKRGFSFANASAKARAQDSFCALSDGANDGMAAITDAMNVKSFFVMMGKYIGRGENSKLNNQKMANNFVLIE